jgi:hypothetical protein
LEFLVVAEFAYNNIVHSSTQQTLSFVNDGLHPKFDIQGVHKVVNLITKDRTIWFVDVQVQLVFNFGKKTKVLQG